MTAKHTPGPWCVWDGPAYVGGGRDLCIGAGDTWLANMDHRDCVRRDEHTDAYTTCGPEDDAAICTIDTEITEEQEANARLIAAAPELLEACRLAFAYFDDEDFSPGYVRKMLSETIAKAEGRS